MSSIVNVTVLTPLANGLAASALVPLIVPILATVDPLTGARIAIVGATVSYNTSIEDTPTVNWL
jgi:hypothetical protein